jgi:hypothetical protein
MKDYFKYSFIVGFIALIFFALRSFIGFLFPQVLRIFEIGFLFMGVYYVIRSIYILLRRWGVSK